MNKEIQQRLGWIKLFEDTNDAGLVCRRCGISRPTLRKWWKRYSEQGIEGLASQSKRPLKSPNTKVNQHIEDLLLQMRSSRNLGARRLQTELMRLHQISLSLATIHKVLTNHQVKPIKKFRRKADYLRYERPLPGDSPHCQNSCHPHPNNLNGGKGDNHGTIQSRTQTNNIKQTAIA